jgi:hypothetical protein
MDGGARVMGFQKGHPRYGGRKKGVPTVHTATIKAGIIEGGAKHGSDGRGSGGWPGYCYYLAKNNPAVFAALVKACIPQKNVEPDNIVAPRTTVINVIGIERGTYIDDGDGDDNFPALELKADEAEVIVDAEAPAAELTADELEHVDLFS